MDLAWKKVGTEALLDWQLKRALDRAMLRTSGAKTALTEAMVRDVEVVVATR